LSLDEVGLAVQFAFEDHYVIVLLGEGVDTGVYIFIQLPINFEKFVQLFDSWMKWQPDIALIV
jgi:hypothetical protein